MALYAITSVSGQQLQPRIAGLETNEQYMRLLATDDELSQREASITKVVESLRSSFRNNPEQGDGSREQIILLENELFELRAQKAAVVDSLNVIEQDWVLNNMGSVTLTEQESQTTLISGDDADVKYIYESQNVKDNLSSIDYRNLVKAEEQEVKAQKLSDDFAVNYDNMLSLSRSYEATSSQTEALEIKERFDSLSAANTKILDQLSDTWGFIYDNKSFAYSMIMEVLGFTDVLQQEAELMRKAQAEISVKQGVGDADERLRYLIQKSSIVEFEKLVAQTLQLTAAADSLAVLSKQLSTMEKESPKAITIEERLFILYKPIEFVGKPYYSSSNPIPETVIYDKGVIFRIYVGSFQTKPPVTTFRNTIPVSHLVNELKRHCYYIGGYQTYEEALQAQEALKKHGFRAPKVVVWYDGKERNLDTDPLPIVSEYRIEISNVATLPSGAADLVAQSIEGGAISKVSNDKFVITSIPRSAQADSLATTLRALDPEMSVAIEKVETKIEF